MGAMSRRKGATFERELARYLTDNGLESKRGIGQARSASEVPDVELDGYWIEAKRHQRTNPKAALAQAIEANGDNGTRPVAICRDNGTSMQEATVTMLLDDWIELVRAKRDLDLVCATAACASESECAAAVRVEADCEEVVP